MSDNTNGLVEVFGYRSFPQGNRLGYFKVKCYLGSQDWLDTDSWKLMKNVNPTQPDEFYILPPSEKDPKGGFRNYASYSLGLKELITQKAIQLYKSSTPTSQ
jgi:hypothetical protein